MSDCPQCGRPVEQEHDHFDGFVRKWGCTPPATAAPVRCECPDPDHDCTNAATDDNSSPRLCTPCLYGCMP